MPATATPDQPQLTEVQLGVLMEAVTVAKAVNNPTWKVKDLRQRLIDNGNDPEDVRAALHFWANHVQTTPGAQPEGFCPRAPSM